MSVHTVHQSTKLTSTKSIFKPSSPLNEPIQIIHCFTFGEPLETSSHRKDERGNLFVSVSEAPGFD